MPAQIERIVDRKLVKARVHYLVVWSGYGEESNTWESRMDLMADGYGAVIKRFEDARKKADAGSSSGASTPTRGRSRSRSPGRSASTPKSPRSRGKSGRGPGRPRGRSRSASVGRKASKAASPEKANQEEGGGNEEEPVVRRSGRQASKLQKEEEPETTTTTFVSRLDGAGERKTEEEEEEDALLLRSTLAVLSTPVVREQAAAETKVTTTMTTTTKTVMLAYEEDAKAATTLSDAHKEKEKEEEEGVLLPRAPTPSAREAGGPARGGVADMVAKLSESGWFVSFLSVAAVVGSLVASQLIPREGDAEAASELWRRWLPALTPVVALLLFFHQKDARASATWVAIALAWRCAAELLVLVGATADEFRTPALASGAVADTALVIALAVSARHGEHAQSTASVLLLTLGVAALFLADSWVVTTENPALDSRVMLMSLAVLAVALSPVLAAASDDED